MENFNSISTNNLENSFCKKMSKNSNMICSMCYANRLLEIRTSLKEYLTDNSKLLSRKVLRVKDIPKFNELYMRFNSFGELINKTHLTNLIKIVLNNPRTNFALYTKRKEYIVNLKNKPSNLFLVYSNPRFNKPIEKIPRNFDKVFNVLEKDTNLKINCKQKCIECLKCYTKNNIKIINEVVK